MNLCLWNAPINIAILFMNWPGTFWVRLAKYAMYGINLVQTQNYLTKGYIKITDK